MPGYKNFDSVVVDYVGKKIPKDEMGFLVRHNATNEWIYVMPHEKSLLRTYSIEPNLGKRGNVLKKRTCKILHTSINGLIFDYIIDRK